MPTYYCDALLLLQMPVYYYCDAHLLLLQCPLTAATMMPTYYYCDPTSTMMFTYYCCNAHLLLLYKAGVEVIRSLIDWVFQNHELKDLLPYGFAIHHAGMTK